LFLCDSGFRLPGEAQKVTATRTSAPDGTLTHARSQVDRLIATFANAYARDNPGVFRSAGSPLPALPRAVFRADNAGVAESAYVVAFALVMLNTDLHDPRLKSGSSSRPPMTQDQFIANMRGVDSEHDFPAQFLQQLFQGIKEAPIEWKGEERKAAPADDTGAWLPQRHHRCAR
jgi:brefeldin A-inhibited guanine nucleotide-exchange protein